MKRSTKTTNRREAQKLADAFEAAARGRVAMGRGMATVREIFGAGEGGTVTVREFAEQWLAELKPSVSPSTHSTYAVGLRHFLNVLGDRAGAPLLHLSREDVMRFRKELAGGHPTTGNQRIKLLRMFVKAAREAGHLFDDPFTGVKLFRKASDSDEEGRRPFTVAELERLLAGADGEWRSLILFGLYTGQRLGDLAALRWGQIDAARGEVSLVTKKTGRRLCLPMPAPLAEHVASIAGDRSPRAFVHPRSAALVAGASGKVSTLSRHFGEMLEALGLRESVAGEAGGAPGRSGRRVLRGLSFHSLRHTLRTMLEAAGVPLATAMEMLGHSDKGSSLHYAHVDAGAMRRAAEMLPRVGAGAGSAGKSVDV